MQVEIQKEPLATIIKKPFDAEYVEVQIALWNSVNVEWSNGSTSPISFIDTGRDMWGHAVNIIIRLEPLPRHPKPDDHNLIHLYAAHGLGVCSDFINDETEEQETWNMNGVLNRMRMDMPVEITHAQHFSERIEIAIKE